MAISRHQMLEAPEARSGKPRVCSLDPHRHPFGLFTLAFNYSFFTCPKYLTTIFVYYVMMVGSLH